MADLTIRLRMDRSDAARAAKLQARDNAAVGDAAVEAAKRGRQANAQVLTEEQAQSRARQQMIQQTNADRVRAARTAMQAETEANTSHSSGIKGTIGAMAGLAAGYATLDTAAKVITTVSGMWAAMRKDIEDSVDRIAQYRNGLLELANLKGRLGQTTPELQSQLDFRAKTLQSRDEAKTFQGGALNTGQSSMAGGFIDKGEFDKLMQYAGSYQAASGSSPVAMGSITGMVPALMGKQGSTAEESFRRMIGIFKTFSDGGSDLGTAIDQFNGTSAMTSAGLFDSMEQQAAVQGFFSVGHQKDAGTLVKQFTRGTVGGLGRMKAEGADESQGEYLKSIGANYQMDPIEIGRLIAQDFKTEQQANPTLKLGEHLTSKGYKDQEAKAAVEEFVVAINNDAFDKTFGAASRGETIPTMADAMDRSQSFQRGADPVAQDRRNQLAKDLADAKIATGPQAYYRGLKKTAFENLRAQGKTYGEFEAQNGSMPFDGQIVDEAFKMLRQAGQKVGVKDTTGSDSGSGGFFGDFTTGPMGMGKGTGPLGGSPFSRLMFSEETRAKGMYEFAQRIRDKGGDVAGMDQLIELTRKSLELQQADAARAAKGVPAFQAPIAPPLRGAPPVPTR